MTVSNRF